MRSICYSILSRIRLKQIIFACLIFSTWVAHAQTDFRPGYIITQPGDTLWGEIDYRGDMLMSQQCKFRPNPQAEITVFKPADIFGYRFNNDKFFITKEFKGNHHFMEYLVDGELDVLFFRDFNGDHYLIEKEGRELVELPYKTGIQKIDGKEYYITSKMHIGLLNLYMDNAPEMKKLILQMKEPKHDNMIKLAKTYHDMVCTDRECIVFEKKTPLIKFNFELLGGVTFLNSKLLQQEKTFESVGFLTHIWLPRVNEKVFLRTGVMSTYLYFSDDWDLSEFYIPIQLEYQYPKGRIRPNAALGMNVYKPLLFLTSAHAGVNFYVNRTLAISLNYDLTTEPDYRIVFMPRGVVSQAVSAGLYIRL